MRKTVLVVGSMASAMLLACMAAVLTAVPGVGKTRTVTLVGAGDIARCDDRSDRNTARLLGKIRGTVFTLGDNAYPDGTRAQFRDCYDPTWGKYKKRTKPAVGNHEYHTAGRSPTSTTSEGAPGSPAEATTPTTAAAWHIVALNSNCEEVGLRLPFSPKGAGSGGTSASTGRSARWPISTTRSMPPVGTTTAPR